MEYEKDEVKRPDKDVRLLMLWVPLDDDNKLRIPYFYDGERVEIIEEVFEVWLKGGIKTEENS